MFFARARFVPIFGLPHGPGEPKQHREGLPSLAVKAGTADLDEDGAARPRWLRFSFRSEFSLFGPLDCRNNGRPQLWQRARGNLPHNQIVNTIVAVSQEI